MKRGSGPDECLKNANFTINMRRKFFGIQDYKKSNVQKDIKFKIQRQ
jgi:hypothetical protein